ncbi:MAG: hypothetical protein NUW01_19850 [Gemmatimonadaceae bacterium]|nr:hypothetical protein [Gemmatimonadaceae bacterium]
MDLPGAPPEPSDPSAFSRVVRMLAPIIAAAGTYRQGALGSFMGGVQDVNQMRQRQAETTASLRERQIERQQNDRYRRDSLTQNEAYRRDSLARLQGESDFRRQQAEETARLRAEAAAEKEAAQQQQFIAGAVSDALTGNPALVEQVNQGADFMLQVPGLGPINLREAMVKAGIPQQGEKFVGAAPKPERLIQFRTDTGSETTEELIPESDAVKRGPHVVSRATPKEPKEPKTPTLKVAYESRTGERVVTYSDPSSGVTTDYTEGDIAVKLQAKGYPSDPDAVAKVLANTKALLELVR